MSLIEKINYFIFIQFSNFNCVCFNCVYRRIRERGFIKYVHCYHCERYFYSYDKFLEHFQRPVNESCCPYPILRLRRIC